jgi:hypothetical protein
LPQRRRPTQCEIENISKSSHDGVDVLACLQVLVVVVIMVGGGGVGDDDDDDDDDGELMMTI